MPAAAHGAWVIAFDADRLSHDAGVV